MDERDAVQSSLREWIYVIADVNAHEEVGFVIILLSSCGTYLVANAECPIDLSRCNTVRGWEYGFSRMMILR